MADDSPPEQSPSPQESSSEASSGPAPPQTTVPSPVIGADRTELLHRARTFLTSPQVQHEDVASKRRFLVEKGLTGAEIEGLLYEVPAPAPSVPARTYPQPPPSKVLPLLLNVFRVFTWVAGGSAALLLAYFRFLYPKIAQSYQARVSLRAQRSALLDSLHRSLDDLRAAQRATFAVLPQPQILQEPKKFATCTGLEQLAEASDGAKDIHPQSLLRCAIADCSKTGQKATSAELFRLLEAKFPWVAEEGSEYEETLWRTLTTNPLFQPAPPPPAHPPSEPPFAPSDPPTPPAPSSDTAWTYTPPTAPPPPPLLSSLSSLSAALPPPRPAQPPPAPKFQHALQALSDLTGYIAAQTYALPYGGGSGGTPTPFRAPGAASLSPEEEDVRREIRALKGLVLNRRSFMPRVPRVSATSADAPLSPPPPPPPPAAAA